MGDDTEQEIVVCNFRPPETTQELNDLDNK